MRPFDVAECSAGDRMVATYTDRRGNDWLVQTGGWRGAYSGHLQWMENPLGERDTYTFDADYNLTGYTEALGHTWSYTYDGSGNLLTASDPLGHVESWTYDAFNNATSYADAEVPANVVMYHYEVAGYPTLLTRIVEPPTLDTTRQGQAVPGNPEAVTTLEYYIKDAPAFDPPASHGRLKQVTDPNGVVTVFDYDRWGQLALYGEGVPDPALDPVYSCNYTANAAGWVTASNCQQGGGLRACGTCSLWVHFRNGRWKTLSCCPIAGCGERSGSSLAIPPGFPALPGGPSLPGPYGDLSMDEEDYNGMGQVLDMNLVLTREESETFYRDFHMQYDGRGRVTMRSIDSSREAAPSGPARDFTRLFSFVHDDALGQYSRVGPDGMETLVQLDAAHRVEHVRRGTPGAPAIEYDVTRYANGLVSGIMPVNGIGSTTYVYDDANRLTMIQHGDVSAGAIVFEYTYNNRDLPTVLTEKVVTLVSEQIRAVVDFTYDNRGRLIEEERIVFPEYGGAGPYHLRYEYDQGGNRTRKVDLAGAPVVIEVLYEYDINDVATYGTANNRLMKAVTNDITGGATTPLSATWYYYNASGNVTRIVTGAEGSEDYSATLLGYARNASAVSFVVGETWNGSDVEGTYNITYAREFRYDAARERYLNRELDPVSLQSTGGLVSVQDTWTDYDNDSVYGDFSVDTGSGSLDDKRSYEPGVAAFFWMDDGSGTWVPDASTVAYYHTDQIGTTRHLTDVNNARIDPAVYSAFGEPIDGPNHRYGYAGAWGYQAHDDFTYLHVGARYYDPASGRFLQRDPIGIRGGSNAYEYVRSSSVARIDPTGLQAGGLPVPTPATPVPSPGSLPSLIPNTPFPRLGLYGALCYGAWELGRRIGDRIVEDTDVEDVIAEHIIEASGNPGPHTDNCFVAGTPVLASNVEIAIEKLIPGDLVTAMDPTGNECTAPEVTGVHGAWAHDLVEVGLPDETVVCTGAHLFWVHGVGWTKASQLQRGDALITAALGHVRVIRIERKKAIIPVRVYNLSVNGLETYFVGTSHVLVHNKNL